jgi:hypothetical protein
MRRWILTSPNGAVMGIEATQGFAQWLRSQGWKVLPA